jgi:hypothetical protein
MSVLFLVIFAVCNVDVVFDVAPGPCVDSQNVVFAKMGHELLCEILVLTLSFERMLEGCKLTENGLIEGTDLIIMKKIFFTTTEERKVLTDTCVLITSLFEGMFFLSLFSRLVDESPTSLGHAIYVSKCIGIDI